MAEHDSPVDEPEDTGKAPGGHSAAGRPEGGTGGKAGTGGKGGKGGTGGMAGEGNSHGAQTEAHEADLVEFAEHAGHAEFAEFAEHAEFAEFAEHAEHETQHVRDGSAEAGMSAHRRLPSHMPGHMRPDAQPDLLWRNEMLHLLDHAAKTLQTAGTTRLHRQDRPEPRWPVSAAVVVAIVLQWKLPAGLALRPASLHWVLLGMEGALVIALIAANPVRIERMSRPIRTASIALIVVITAANAVSAGLLIKAIVTNDLHVSPQNAAIALLASGAAIWGTNVIAFALWYWEFDRGGPVNRLEGKSPYPDLMFPQMTVPELTPQGWGPRFIDYLYLSFTNATAFSPTDTMPMVRWAKLTMLVQSAVSLALGALVIARAVNILQ